MPLGKGMNLFIHPALDLMVSLLLFYKDGFAIKWPTKDDMPLSKETKHLLDQQIKQQALCRER